jgi:branched-chain amino acid transport system substrate-binding protein
MPGPDRGRHLRLAALAALAVLALALPACGAEEPETTGGQVLGDTLTVYSSLPLRGDSRTDGEDALNGIKLALAQAGGKAGRFNVNLVSLDDSTPDSERWEPGQVAANARRAAQDRATIAYIGELDTGASAISVPILNEAGMLQVSPGDTLTGLTRPESADKGAPDRYYPSGNRNFARVVPADNVQAAAVVRYMEDNGVSTLHVLDVKGIDARLATLVERAARAEGLRVVGRDRVRAGRADYDDVGERVAASGADAVFFAGNAEDGAAEVWEAIEAASSEVKLFGGSPLAEPGFARALDRSARGTYLTAPPLAPARYPQAATEFFDTYRETYGRNAGLWAIYGYESMQLVLDAIERAGDLGNDRQTVIDQVFQTADRESVLGTYSIDENGDTTLEQYGTWRPQGGRLEFDQVLRPHDGT